MGSVKKYLECVWQMRKGNGDYMGNVLGVNVDHDEHNYVRV